MKRPKTVVFILAVVCIGIAAGICFGVVMPVFENLNISKNGTDAIAIVTDVPESTTPVGTEYFYVKFMFTNEYGETIHGKTNAAYTMEDLRSMGIVVVNYYAYEYHIQSDATIAISYIGDKAVAQDYIISIGEKVAMAITVLAGAAGVILLVMVLLMALGLIGRDKIMKKGIEETGTYLDCTLGMVVTGTPYFRIHFTFTNQQGELITAKTGSMYTENQAETFAMLRTFPIKYAGKKAVILLDKNQLSEAQSNMFKK